MIQFEGHPATITSLAFSPDSTTLASGAKDGGLKLWDAAGGLVREWNPEGNAARRSLAWSASGDRLFTSAGTGVVALRPREVEVAWHDHPAGGDPVSSLCAISDQLLAVGRSQPNDAPSGTLVLWDVSRGTRRPVPPTICGFHGVRAITAHPPTKRLHWIAALSNTPRCLWRSWSITSPNAAVTKLNKPAADITVSPDGGTVAIASDWLVRVFTADGKPRVDLSGHKGLVSAVGFIHGGRTVVSASWDGTVRLWDVATGKETARFPLAVGKLTALAVSPDGTRVAAGGTDGPIVLIDAE